MAGSPNLTSNAQEAEGTVMDILVGILEQGMIYGILALGVYITFRILNFPDLTVDGSFPLGAAVTALLMTGGDSDLIQGLTLGQDPYLISLYALLAGSLAGLVTGMIHVRLKVGALISGLITMTALYSINLRIAGSANVPIFNLDTIMSNDWMDRLFPDSLRRFQGLITVTVIALVIKLILDWYLKTRSGYLLRAAGSNAVLVTTLARDSGNVKILGIVLANGLVALSGSIMMQQQGFFEITMGTGTMVMGLASVIIGTTLFKHLGLVRSTTAVLAGSILYKAAISLAMDINFARASDMKLITSILFLIILVVGQGKRKVTIDA